MSGYKLLGSGDDAGEFELVPSTAKRSKLSLEDILEKFSSSADSLSSKMSLCCLVRRF